jgi:putative ATP-dependent endonuclease of OLD family
MKSLQHDATEKGVQILVTTHSPTLASAIELDNLVIIRNRRAFPLAEGRTKLDSSDYRFLTRFLDATKANLFFARGVMIVEGDAENILLPTLARLIGRDLTDHGVSIVNVGGIGLHRYARVFQRANPVEDGALDIPVACVTDMDVMPDCAPVITGRVEAGKPWPAAVDRRWRAKSDIGGEDALCKVRSEKRARASGQSVRTFVSDEWTLEYDLALGPKNPTAGTRIGLAEDVYIAACLAKKDDAISAKKSTVEEVAKAALSDFAELSAAVETSEGCSPEEVLATKVYAQFAKHQASKAVAAQYLAERLQNRYSTRELTEELLRKRLPNYLVDAIDYVTGLPDRRAGVGGN